MTAAVLLPAALAGWLAWQSAGGTDGEGPAGARPGPSGAAPARTDPGTPDPKNSTRPETGTRTPENGTGKPSAPERARPRPGPLSGRTVVIDPGHNPGNFQHTAEINRKVDIGTNRKECDTTGTSTNDGYTEAAFTRDVSQRLRTLLEKQGARVEFTHDNDRPFGPCVDERARIGNSAGADAAISVHADGSAQGNRGFHVILPGAVRAGGADTGPIVGPSRELGERIAGRFVRATGSAPANYVGGGTALDVRKDLGGLNLSTVPKVFIECGNMRDSRDAALLKSPEWRQKAALGIAEGVHGFLLR
ncbi:N-acetylmuramoyl-L-alanine amidase [Streptomyces sp. CAU 1734]|uniref:N-acetylmuramoyl-L-alanine amidase n=1 Tax=Streptomyces sp. CAU 1734 TaxID=3140360 RepID=UPI003260DAF1